MTDQQPSERAKAVAAQQMPAEAGFARVSRVLLAREIDRQFPGYDALRWTCEGWREVEQQAAGENIEMPAHLAMAM